MVECIFVSSPVQVLKVSSCIGSLWLITGVLASVCTLYSGTSLIRTEESVLISGVVKHTNVAFGATKSVKIIL